MFRGVQPPIQLSGFRMRLVHAIAGVACLSLAAVAYAQSTAIAAPEAPPVQAAPLVEAPAHWGDAKAGQAKAAICAACHGLDGNATANPALYPRIAGQNEQYIIDALNVIARQLRNAYIYSGEERAKSIEQIEPQRKIITDEIAKLEKQARTEKQPKKKFELVQRVKALKKLIKELNGSEE